MNTRIFALLIVIASLSCLAAQPGVGVAAIGQPSIFWHNGEWQTYKDGVWTPYGQAERSHSSRPGNEKVDAASGSLRIGILRNSGREKSIHRSGESNPGIGQTTIGIGQPNGIGQTTGAIGQPNVGIGRTTIGIGQPNVGIGQPNGIGRT